MCTAMSLKSKEKEMFLCRTVDFYHELNLELYYVPKNNLFKSSVSNYSCSSKYAFIGSGKYINEVLLSDGVNDEGLGVAALYFPGYACFHKTNHNKKNTIANTEVVTYLLGNCKNIAEVIKLIYATHIVEVIDYSMDIVAPLHWIVSDKSGKTITIEQTRAGLHIFNNSVGVLSNSPDFSWHYTNLRNYTNITCMPCVSKEWNNITLSPFGEGGGSFGLPGDFTSPARFIRLSFAKSFASIPDTKEEMLLLCFHLLKLVFIPKGLVMSNINKKNFDYTQYMVVMNLNKGEYSFNTYQDEKIKSISIHDIKENKIISLGKM